MPRFNDFLTDFQKKPIVLQSNIFGIYDAASFSVLRASLLIVSFSKLPRGVVEHDCISRQSSVAVVFFFF